MEENLKPRKGIIKNLDGSEYVPQEVSKIESLSTAISIAKGLLSQVERDSEMYTKMAEEQFGAIVDQRVLALHKIPYNANMISYGSITKELTNQLKDLQEEYEKEIQNAKDQATLSKD